MKRSEPIGCYSTNLADFNDLARDRRTRRHSRLPLRPMVTSSHPVRVLLGIVFVITFASMIGYVYQTYDIYVISDEKSNLGPGGQDVEVLQSSADCVGDNCPGDGEAAVQARLESEKEKTAHVEEVLQRPVVENESQREQIESSKSIDGQAQNPFTPAGFRVGCHTISSQMSPEYFTHSRGTYHNYAGDISSSRERYNALYKDLGYAPRRLKDKPGFDHSRSSFEKLLTEEIREGSRHIFRIDGLDTSKARVAKLTKLFLHKHRCSYIDKASEILTWDLSDERECGEFFSYAQAPERAGTWWILKPDGGKGGEGIKIFVGIEEALKYAGCQGNDEMVVQEYVRDVVHFDGRKADLRSFMLVASTRPFIVMHAEGYVRVAMEKLDPRNGTSPSLAQHITNSHFQNETLGNHTVTNHIVSLPDLAEYLSNQKQSPCNSTQTCHDRIESQVMEIEKFLFRAWKDHLRRMSGASHLLAIDYLVKNDLTVQLVEANGGPGMKNVFQSAFLENLFNTIVRDHHDVILELHENNHNTTQYAPGTRWSGFEVIYNEAYEECYSKFVYDPCPHHRDREERGSSDQARL